MRDSYLVDVERLTTKCSGKPFGAELLEREFLDVLDQMSDQFGRSLVVTIVDLPALGTTWSPTSRRTSVRSKDFVSDQEVRWCPGCGDYAFSSAVQRVLPDLGLRREKIAFISGIGC